MTLLIVLLTIKVLKSNVYGIKWNISDVYCYIQAKRGYKTRKLGPTQLKWP